MHETPSAAVESVRAVRRRTLTRRVWFDSELPPELVHEIVSGEPDRLLFLSEPLQIKDRCAVARHDSSAGPLLIKRHNWGGFWRALRMAFRPPAARRCAELGLHLNRRGILTPRPRAYVDFRFGPWTHRSFLVSDYVEGESLYRYIRFGSQSTDELRHLARQVAKIWQTLVDLNVSHNDMKPENFIVDANRDVWLIDLEKVHIGGSTKRLRARQLFDINNFLHVRGWHRRLEARTIFAEAFLQTRYGEWLRSSGIEKVARGDNGQSDQAMSVVVLCNDGIEMAVAQHAIDSVRDIADEVVLVEVDNLGRLQRSRHIELLSRNPRFVDRNATGKASPLLPELCSPWILLLRQTERVTPFLAKELQQRIAEDNAGDGFLIPIETQLFGRTLNRANPTEPRLLRRSSNLFGRANDAGTLVPVSTEGTALATLVGAIQDCACPTVSECVNRL